MPPSKKKPEPVEYRVLQGLDYPPMRRAEPGDVVSDLPAESIPWLIESGAITPKED